MEIAKQIASSWIYDFSDYQQMYDLSEADLSKSLLDFSAGIASFNVEAMQRGCSVMSVDMNYGLSQEQMRLFAEQFLRDTTMCLNEKPGRLQDSSLGNIQHVAQRWRETEKRFIQDYTKDTQKKRYQAMQLPRLPYATHQFDIALCTDFIFHHSLSSNEVQVVVRELGRVASEVRIFPLLDANGKTSDALGPLMLLLQKNNYGVEVRQVPYQTLKGGNAMLRIWEQECRL
jgi:hypothetical protein